MLNHDQLFKREDGTVTDSANHMVDPRMFELLFSKGDHADAVAMAMLSPLLQSDKNPTGWKLSDLLIIASAETSHQSLSYCGIHHPTAHAWVDGYRELSDKLVELAQLHLDLSKLPPIPEELVQAKLAEVERQRLARSSHLFEENDCSQVLTTLDSSQTLVSSGDK